MYFIDNGKIRLTKLSIKNENDSSEKQSMRACHSYLYAKHLLKDSYEVEKN